MSTLIACIGAFDRNNYGDLLFPLCVKHEIEQIDDCNLTLDFFALRQADFTPFGGVAVRPLLELSAISSKFDKVVVVVGGGEVLTATWDMLFANLQSRHDPVPQFLRRHLKDRFRTRYLRFRYGAGDYPFVPDPLVYGPNVKVVYNGVGGCALGGARCKELRYIEESLAASELIAVRDKVTFAAVSARPSLSDKVILTPDPASSLAEMFPRGVLREFSTDASNEIIDEFGSGCYIAFQCNEVTFKGRENQILAIVEEIADRTNLPIVLVPIGQALGHGDQLVNEYVAENAKSVAVPFRPRRLHDVANVIANSRCFAGTSLHGAITSIAYGVRFVPMDWYVPKLKAYLSTWGGGTQETGSVMREVADRVVDVATSSANQAIDIQSVIAGSHEYRKERLLSCVI
ncbi:polysaccharide pyruvyl transferase family protein [Roseiconus lacunae]|uniref:polysaccharide pyruvyl transferase family protein n=1 Tax=Roseiconus lacunae TaxID=2605694 RepID=UPI0011F1043C|nr:polysaccharide pyruvyl transferase family protein [Roseiconus lacunae]